MRSFLRNNGLSLAFLLLFSGAMSGQIFFGWHSYNQQRILEHGRALPLGAYLGSGHFMEATCENWESEFLQMALYVVLTIFLFQKGSSESKKPGAKEPVDRTPDPGRESAPWPVKKGAFILKLYSHSLTIAFAVLFLASFALHFYGSLREHNGQAALRGQPLETAVQYLGDAGFWFESFQNWQSEFLSVFCVVLFPIWLRQKGSAQSKPVDAPDFETVK